ncbi:MAG: hypothetical protein HYW88_01100 [Candidatus Sungbacteria bacterium]|nr:hypothetical protein [Candidatus Sungbacteria bacterium]
MEKLKVKIFLGTLPLLAAPMLVLAQSGAQLNTVCDIVNLVYKAKDVFAYLVYIFAFMAILYSAFLFLTSGGSEEKVKNARNALIWGLVGIAVALFSSYAVDFVAGIVGGNATTTCN